MDADRRGWLSAEEASRLRRNYYLMCFFLRDPRLTQLERQPFEVGSS
jgi:hypothetical protein